MDITVMSTVRITHLSKLPAYPISQRAADNNPFSSTECATHRQSHMSAVDDSIATELLSITSAFSAAIKAANIISDCAAVSISVCATFCGPVSAQRAAQLSAIASAVYAASKPPFS